ncbi:unnamed protein product [Eruca vesicaria subsp. sativa]|uniref:Uncharacterized protein n=1 Tax=Eruca vesicaria subsp. sativa TaxID=29727 RepID=A0ABC8L1C0_ERUVS|nr:unnamed protein product [Eruca vesicaria subsp. sativa]
MLTKARAAVGVGPLTWDLKVALYASTHTNWLILVCAFKYLEMRADNFYGIYQCMKDEEEMMKV